MTRQVFPSPRPPCAEAAHDWDIPDPQQAQLWIATCKVCGAKKLLTNPGGP